MSPAWAANARKPGNLRAAQAGASGTAISCDEIGRSSAAAMPPRAIAVLPFVEATRWKRLVRNDHSRTSIAKMLGEPLRKRSRMFRTTRSSPLPLVEVAPQDDGGRLTEATGLKLAPWSSRLR